MSKTDKESDKNEERLYQIRHSLAHVMAQAVLGMRPDAKLAFGPPVENGFYYDFDFGDSPLTPEEFPEIEERMREIIKERQEFKMTTRPASEAISELEGQGEIYKAEYAKEFEVNDIDGKCPRPLSLGEA